MPLQLCFVFSPYAPAFLLNSPKTRQYFVFSPLSVFHKAAICFSGEEFAQNLRHDFNKAFKNGPKHVHFSSLLITHCFSVNWTAIKNFFDVN